jgi:hypothetical protein
MFTITVTANTWDEVREQAKELLRSGEASAESTHLSRLAGEDETLAFWRGQVEAYLDYVSVSPRPAVVLELICREAPISRGDLQRMVADRQREPIEAIKIGWGGTMSSFGHAARHFDTRYPYRTVRENGEEVFHIAPELQRLFLEAVEGRRAKRPR